MLAWIAARSAYFGNGFPLYKAIILGVALALAIAVMLTLVALAFFLTSSGSLKRRRALMQRPTNDIVTEYLYDWLLMVADKDLREINQAIRVIGCTVDWITDVSPPYAKFKFEIYNGSVYLVSILANMEGFISYEGSRLKGEMVMSREWMIENLPPRSTSKFEIRQELTRREANKITDSWNKQDFSTEFRLDQLVVYAKGGDNFPYVITRSLSFPFTGIRLNQALID